MIDKDSNADLTEGFQTIGGGSKSVYEIIIREMEDAVFLIDVEQMDDDYTFTFRRNNAAHREVTGLSEDELRGQTPQELLGDEQGATVAANYRRCAEQRETIQYEETLEFPSGRSHWQTKLTPVTDDDQLTQIVGVARDITDQKEQQEKLQQLHRRFETVLETMSAAVFLKDTDGQYLLMNRACRELFNVTDEKIADLTDEDLFPPKIAEKATKDDQQVIENGKMIETEEKVPTATGDTVRVTRKSPVYADNGEVVGLCGVSTDISKQKQQERELERQNEQLEEFASVVSHDLRSPLNVAEGRLELAKTEHDSEHLASIETALDRMDAIIDKTLELARKGQDIESVDPVPLANAVDEMWVLVGDDVEDARLQYADDEPLTDPIRANYDLLRQLVENLLRNGIEHGGEDVTITVGKLDDGFYIEDDGPGIPTESRDDVFAVGYSTAEDGTGFGLSIVKKIVEAHDWEIHVGEAIDGGARFEITGVETAA